MNEQKRRIRVAVTDTKGKAVFSNLPEGNYALEVSYEGYVPTSKQVVVTQGNPIVKVGLQPINKMALRHENERLRGLIIASVALDQINTYLSQIHTLVDLSPDPFRSHALKRFRKTSKVAHNRIEELRTTRKSIGLSLSPREFKGSFRRSVNKKTLA